MSVKTAIRREAQALGFTLCGFAPVQPPPHGDFVRRWIADGNAGTMSYIGRGLKKRLDPNRLLPSLAGVVTVGYPYAPKRIPPVDWRNELRGRIAAYALGRDYHGVILEKLYALAAAIRNLGAAVARPYVDTGPVLEREWASLGGIGWFGKNTMLLHQREGSWFFLGEVLTDLEFDSEPIIQDHCGTCRRCLDLCPTGALQPGYRMDARLCISYLTIEYRGIIPPVLRPQMGEWIFGCDVCQEVCPWNDRGDEEEVCSGDALDAHAFLPDLLDLNADGYERRFGDTAVSRARYDCFLRNVAIALGNTGNPRAVSSLARALACHPAVLVRVHAAWALGQIADANARRALEQAWTREDEEAVRRELHSVLAGSDASDGIGGACRSKL
jgi:epoxyqueuosine reductase